MVVTNALDSSDSRANQSVAMYKTSTDTMSEKVLDFLDSQPVSLHQLYARRKPTIFIRLLRRSTRIFRLHILFTPPGLERRRYPRGESNENRSLPFKQSPLNTICIRLVNNSPFPVPRRRKNRTATLPGKCAKRSLEAKCSTMQRVRIIIETS